jgi:hypothetical protein
MNCVQKINNLKNKIENAEHVLTSKIDNTPMKDDREALLTQVKTNILVIEKEHKILSKQNKKIKNRTHQMNASSRLKECSQKIEELKILIVRQEEKLAQNEEEVRSENEDIDSEGSFDNQVLKNDAQTLQFYHNEDQKFKEGVQATKAMLKGMKLANMKLDHISMLVIEQRNKLKNIKGEIKKSQSLMAQTKKIMRAFSAELVKDKFIKVLLISITVVLLFIMVCAIKYKMKSQALIGKEIDVTDDSIDYDEINEELFWRAEIKIINKSQPKRLQKENIPQANDALMNFDFSDSTDKKLS